MPREVRAGLKDDLADQQAGIPFGMLVTDQCDRDASVGSGITRMAVEIPLESLQLQDITEGEWL